MKASRFLLYAGLGACVLCLVPQSVFAHGFVGERFFPPTISTDDPIASDELSTAVSFFENPGASDGGPDSKELDANVSFSKLIAPHFALAVSETYSAIKTDGSPTATGWSNLELNGKYEVYQNDPHEFIASVGFTTGIGGTGSTNIGADSFTTLSPEIYLGKGLGDLPDSVGWLRPLAVTLTLTQNFPTSAQASDSFESGIAIEYSIPYLQQSVVDLGIPAPFKDMIPLVEITTSTDENGDTRGQTTGTVNPGVLYESRYFQVGLEAIIPMNSDSGAHVGALLNVNIFIDDIFPDTFGFPIFGGK